MQGRKKRDLREISQVPGSMIPNGEFFYFVELKPGS